MEIKLGEKLYDRKKNDFYYHTRFNENVIENDEDIKSIIKVMFVFNLVE